MTKIKIDEEFEKIIPALTNEEFKQLESNCIKNGVQDSIKLWNDIIIDGHNRFRIAEENNLKFEIEQMQFDSRQDVIEWMLINQMGRRNLNNYDRGLLALKLQEIIKIKGLENMSKANKTSNKLYNASMISSKHYSKKLNNDNIDSRKEASKAFNVSEDTLNKVKHIEEKANNETKEKLKNGEITVNKAYQDIKKQEKRKEIEEQKIDQNVKSESIDIYSTKNKYKVIYADPPWSYGNNMPEYFGEQKDHYKLMSLKAICDMPIKNITEKNAVLFLWVTSPILEESFQVIKAWGFKYKSSFVWDKIKHNMGHYNSVRHELLLIATKGSCIPDNIKLFDSVQSIERKKHSEKPEEFRKIIDHLYIGNKIELFARKKMKGWAFYGNERI